MLWSEDFGSQPLLMGNKNRLQKATKNNGTKMTVPRAVKAVKPWKVRKKTLYPAGAGTAYGSEAVKFLSNDRL